GSAGDFRPVGEVPAFIEALDVDAEVFAFRPISEGRENRLRRRPGRVEAELEPALAFVDHLEGIGVPFGAPVGDRPGIPGGVAAFLIGTDRDLRLGNATRIAFGEQGLKPLVVGDAGVLYPWKAEIAGDLGVKRRSPEAVLHDLRTPEH